jgi:hypothetical protein
MDFIVGLPRISRGYNSIWVIVDCLTKSTDFIPVSTTYRVRQYAELYISHIEGPKKATRGGGVNMSQLKFLDET